VIARMVLTLPESAGVSHGGDVAPEGLDFPGCFCSRTVVAVSADKTDEVEMTPRGRQT